MERLHCPTLFRFLLKHFRKEKGRITKQTDVCRCATMILRLITTYLIFSSTSAVGSSRTDSRGAAKSGSNSSTSSPNTTSVVQTSTAATTTTESQSAKKAMAALASIQTFDLPQTESLPTRAVEEECNMVDTCVNDICNHGTCVMPNCSFSCVCDPGYKGQFCDQLIKRHVNGEIHLDIDSTDNGHSNEEKSAKDNGNGHIVDNGIVSSDDTTKGKKGTNGNYDKIDNGSSSTTEIKGNGDKTTHVKSTNHANIGARADIQSPGKIKRKPSNEKKLNSVKQSITGSIGSKSSSPNESRVVANGYVKGPEIYVPSDSSVVKVKTSQKKIPTDKPAVINQPSDTVTLSTVSIKDTRVRLPKESIKSSETKGKPASALGLGSDNKGTIKSKSNEGKPLNDKATVDNDSIDNKKHKIISKSGVAQSNHAALAKNAGTNKDPRSAIAANNGPDVSDIKITMEMSPKKENTKQSVDNDNNHARVNEPTIKQKSTLNKNQDKVTNTSKKRKQKKTSVKANTGGQKVESGKDVAKQGAQKQNKTTNAKNILVSSDVISSANQHTETRKTMRSSILNPVLFKFLNLIGSPKFVDNVSAVKIEIITKQNQTSSVKGDNSTGLDKTSVSTENNSAKNVVSSTQTDKAKVDKERRNVHPGPP